MSDAEKLTLRRLNRATLARQMLLEREALGVAEAVQRLGGLQAQEPRPPFAALWSRLRSVDPEDVRAALARREVVRATSMRATLHLLSRGDYLALRRALAPALSAAMGGALKGRMEGLDPAKVLAAAERLLADRPLTFDELRAALSARFPAANERALGYVVRTQLPLVIVPTDDRWGFGRTPAVTPAAAWLGESPAEEGDPQALVRRHLAAFGPATVADVQAWSGVKGLKGAVAGMRDELRTFVDERGRELFDVPDGPLPPQDADAPPRLLAPFDSVVLALADRRRLIADEHKPRLATRNLRVPATFLVDGVVAGTWGTERKA